MNRRLFNASMMGIAGLSTLKAEQDETTESKQQPIIRLKNGDKVGVIAPAGPIKEDRFVNVETNLGNLGLQAVYGKYIREKNGYLAGNDEQRLEDLHAMYANKEVKAVWCLRGGYGTTRILSQMDYKLIRKNPKPIIGFSDITGPLLSIYHKTQVKGYHGAMLASKWSDFTLENTKSMILGEENEISFLPIAEGERKDDEYGYTIVPGIAVGELIGGNLTLLAALCGTPFLPSFKNKLVFLEDVGEEPYRIDRMLVQLRMASDIEKAAGFVLGIFNDCNPKEEEFSYSLRDTLTSQFHTMGKPTYYGAPFGHIDKIAPLPIGAVAKMDANAMKLSITL